MYRTKNIYVCVMYTNGMDLNHIKKPDHNKNATYNLVNKMINTLTLSPPFNLYYSNVKEHIAHNYIIYENTFRELPKMYNILDSDNYGTFDNEPNEKYSTEKILVYTRKTKELEKMMTFEYYNSFNFQYLESYNYNPNLYYSKFDNNNNILTPTITPYTKNIVSINLDYSAYDFFNNSELLTNMYNTYKDLSYDNTFLVYNSLEGGSLPEVYHYHIQKVKLFDINLSHEVTEGLIEINPLNSSFAPMYAIKITDDNISHILNNFPKFAYKCREVKIGDDIYKYIIQIFFYTFKGNKYLLFSFRRTNTKNIKVNKGRIIQEYWDDIYGKAYDKYGIIYLPVGIIIYGNKENKELILTDDIINEMKRPFITHPNIIKLFNTYMRNEPVVHINNYSNLKECTNIPKIISNSIIEGFVENIFCRRLPYLYTFKEQYYGKETNCGLLDIGGNKFFSMQVNEALEKNIIYNDVFKNTNYIFPLYYASFTHNSSKYMIFQELLTNLHAYIDFDNKNLEINNNIINSFMLVVLHNLIKLNKMHNVVYNIESLHDIYVFPENRQFIEYNFDNNIVIPIIKNNNEIKINHYGKNILFKFKDINNNHITVEESYIKFIKLLSEKLNSYGVINPTINNIMQDFDNNYSINKSVNHFLYAVNMFAHKLNLYDAYTWCKKMVCAQYKDVQCDNDLVIQQYIIHIIKNTPNQSFDMTIIKKGNIYVSGTFNNEYTNIDMYQENIFFSNQIIYLTSYNYLVSEADVYRDLLNNPYALNSTTSRVIMFRVIADTEVPNFNYKSYSNMMKSFRDIINSSLNITEPKVKDMIHNLIDDTIQDILHYIMKNKYNTFNGYFNYNYNDGMYELIAFKPANFLEIISVMKITPNGIMLFNNISIFNNWMKNEIFKYVENMYIDLLNISPFIKQKILGKNISNIYDIIPIFKEHLDLYINNNIYDKFDMFTIPIFDSAIHLIDYEIPLFNKTLDGGYYKKYIDMKKKYIRAKKIDN